MQFLVKIAKHCESWVIFKTQQNIKMELFAEKVNCFQPFIIFVKSAILNVLNVFWILNTILNMSLQALITFARSFLLDAWLGFKYISYISLTSSFGRNSEPNYVEWQLMRGVLEKSCLGKLSQIHIRNILLQ